MSATGRCQKEGSMVVSLYESNAGHLYICHNVCYNISGVDTDFLTDAKALMRGCTQDWTVEAIEPGDIQRATLIAETGGKTIDVKRNYRSGEVLAAYAGRRYLRILNMRRKRYHPTKSQIRRWDKFEQRSPMPSDEESKVRWAKRHGGKTRGWGLAKRDWILSNMKYCREYQMGLWQGRVDHARGLEYMGEAIEEGGDVSAYKMGYYIGYVDYKSNRRGWDKETCRRFDQEYLSDL